jgi:transglutaminase-like putative cysteine protease
MTGLTRRTGILVLVAQICALLAAATSAGAAMTFAFVALCLLGSTAPARRIAGHTAVRLLLQLLMITVTVSVLAQLGNPQPELLKTKLLPLLLALLVLRVPVTQTRRDDAVNLVIATMVLVVCAALVSTFADGVPLLLAWPMVLVAAVALHHDALTDGDVAVATRSNSSFNVGRASYVAPTALACALGLVVWLLLPSGASATLRDKFGVKSRTPFGSSSSPADGEPGQRVAAAYTAGQLDLSLRGALPTDPVLRVPVDSPQLWRVQVFTEYDGRFWTARSQPQQIVQGGPIHTLPPTQDVFDTAGVAREDVAVPLLPGPDAPVWSPGLPIAVDTHGQVIVDNVGVTHVFGLGRAPTYSVRSVAPDADAAQLRDSQGADPGDRAWTALPGRVPQRVGALARSITRGSSDRFTAMRKVEAWLRSNILYDLNAPVAPPGGDAVDTLLFDTHRGFCEHFASAETVLLRSVGIPARVVTGLAGGDVGTIPHTREFLANDAHAWVEVYFPGIGWVDSDPTAGAELASANDGRNLAALVVDSFRDSLNALTRVPGGRRTLALVVAALAFLAVLVGRRPRRVGVAVAAPDRRRRGPVLLAFLTYEQRRRALRTRELGESPREFVAAAGELDALEDAVAVLEQECYGRRQPVGAAAAVAAAAFESAAPTVPSPQTLSSE